MFWNYRVVERGNTYAIHEVNYDDAGHILSATEVPVFPIGESVKELKEEIAHYSKAFKLPVLKYTDIPGASCDDERHPYRSQKLIGSAAT